MFTVRMSSGLGKGWMSTVDNGLQGLRLGKLGESGPASRMDKVFEFSRPFNITVEHPEKSCTLAFRILMLLCPFFWLTSWLWDMPLAMSYVGKIALQKLELPNWLRKQVCLLKARHQDIHFLTRICNLCLFYFPLIDCHMSFGTLPNISCQQSRPN